MNIQRTPWQRLALSLFGIGVLWLNWRHSIAKLVDYTQEDQVAAFTTLTVNNQWAIVTIVVFMVTGKLFMDWKSNTAKTAIDAGASIISAKTKKQDMEAET